MSWPIMTAESVAGPSVEMIFVRRTMPRCMGKTYKYAARLKVFNRDATVPAAKQTCFCVKSRPYFWTKFMADAANKYPENVAGKFYVDNQCIDCDLCRETAPDNYKRNDDGGYSFVYKQPTTPEEEARCKEAKEGCPVEAIGDNGA
jgi:ferredoxin